MKTKTLLHRIAALFALALLTTFGATHEAKAQTNAFTNATYTFGTDGNTNSFAYNGSDVANLTEGNMVKSSGITTSGSSGNFRATGWTTGSSLDANDYIGFTLTADSGWTLNMTNMTFGIGRSGAGTRAWAWYYSTNSFSSSLILTNYTTLAAGLTNTAGVLSHADLNSSWTGNVLNLSSLTNLGTVEFRLYSWLAEGGTGTAGLQGPLSFSGSMVSSAVAAPGNFWSGNVGGGGSGIWTSSSTNWATNANGAGRGGTQATSGALVFTNTAGTVDVGDPVTVNAGMQFATDGYTVRSNTITLAGANAAANTITTDTGVGTTINSVLAGSTGMTKAGAGTLTLGGANTYTGGTTVSGGRLVGDTLSLQGNIANTAAVTFSQTTNGTYGGVISGSGGTVTKSGTGTVTFTQNNTYTGATTVSGGRLVVNGSQSSSAVTVNSGASLAGSGTVGGLTVSGLLAPGTSVGTLSAGSTTFEGGGSFELEIFDWVNVAGTGWDLFAITGDLTLNNTSGSPFTINLVSLANSTTPGLSTDWDQNVNFTNTFVTVSGSLLGTPFASNLFTVNTNGFQNTVNGTFSITNVGNNLALLYTTSFVPATEYIWNTGAGAWGTGGSWSGGVAPSNNSAIIFSGAGGASTNNLVNTVQSLLFSNSAGSYTVSGDALTVGALGIDNESTAAQTINNNLTLGAAQTFLAANGDLTLGGTIDNSGNLLTIAGNSNTAINGAISGNGGLTKSGTGSLTLGGNNSYTGALSANGGTTLVNGTQAATTINVGGGTLLLGASDVLANGATVALTTGTVNFGGFSDTITTFNQSGGVFTNGTLSAATYGLSGGTVGGTLGAGTANVTGVVTLSGVIDSTLNINTGGTLTLAAADRINNSSAVTVDAGTLATATFNDTVGSVVLTNSGSITGTGTITAGTYTLNGGTVGANLGTGTATSSAGTTTLNGTLAGDLAVSGGTLTLGGADRLANSSAVTVSSGTLNLGGFTDTVGSFSLSGGVFTNGTVTTTTYALSGGTMGGTLGAGTANVTGGVTLSGVIDSTLNINTGGTLTLAAADRINNSSAVTVDAGTLATATFNDTVGSLLLTNNGSITGTGTITAGTYILNGGTVSANLGAGTANVSAGTTTLNGAFAVTTLNIDGGTLALGGNGRIDNAAVVNLSSGVLDMVTFADGVGTFNMTGGTVNGSGANLLSAVNGLNLQAGTINANIGNSAVGISNGTTTINGTVDGAVTVSSGTADLNGALASSLTASGGTVNLSNTVAGNVTVSGGTVNLGSADRIGASSAVNVSSGSLNLNGNDSVGAVTLTGGTIGGSGVLTGTSYAVQDGTISAGIGGSGAMTKTGAGTTTLSANNSGFSGAVAVNQGAILAGTSGALGSGTVTVTNGSALAASGVTLANDFTIGNPAGLQVFYSQDFNSLGTSATASLPTDWKFSAAGAGTTGTFWTNAGNLTATTQAASSGAPTAGGRYNWGFSADTNNRAVGFMSSGSYAEPNSIMFAFTNTTGQTITDFTVSFDYLRFRTNSTAISNVFYMSDSSTSWGNAISTNVWATGTSGYNFAPAPVSLTNTISLTITNGGVAYMMWTFDATGSGNSQGLGLDNVVINTPGGPTGSGTLGIEEAGTATFSGNILNNNSATFTAASGGLATFSGTVSGNGSVSKTGTGTVTLSGSNSYSGGTTLNEGVLRLDSATAAGTGSITQTNTNSTLEINTTGTVANAMSIFNVRTLQTVTLSGNKTLNNATYTVDAGTTTTESGVLSGGGGITKEGTGSLVVTASNSFTGATVVNAGTLNLNSSTGSALGASTSVTVAATLLISQSGQVADNAAITLSGGTISRASGVSEVFGSLNLTQASFLDFGTGATGNLTFGTYQNNETPSALLTLNNFLPGNSFTFNSTSFTEGSINNYFSFGTGYVNSSITNTGSTFTITAIPEPSTYLAAAGLLSLMLWPSRKRLLKDAKKIFGLTPPMRDRLAAKRA